MDDELELDLIENPSEKRIKELSYKVKTTASERDDISRQLEEAKAQLAEKEKESEFFTAFTESVSQYPEAKEFQADIKAKVLAGYTVEDATISTLAKAGRLTTAVQQQLAQQPAIERTSPVGGSATNTLVSNKSIADMTQAERLQELRDAEKRGDLLMT